MTLTNCKLRTVIIVIREKGGVVDDVSDLHRDIAVQVRGIKLESLYIYD